MTRRRLRAVVEFIIERMLFLCAAGSILVTAGIVLVLLFETAAFLSEVPITEFLFGTVWTPLFFDKHFGVLPLVTGTLLASGIAMLIALPAGLMTAVYLSEYAPSIVRRTVKPVLELLAGVPTVVYGYFALLFVTPKLQAIVPGLSGFNALSPGIVMGIMILPLVSSLSEDALRSVPNGLREGAYALGATRMEAALRVVLPAAFSGHLCGVRSRGIARDRRNDDRGDRGRTAASADTRSSRAGRDHDRLHRAGQSGRHAGRHDRVPHHLCRRHAAVRQHVRAQPVLELVARALPGKIRMTSTAATAPETERSLNTGTRRARDWLFASFGLLSTLLGLVALGALLYDVISDGAGRLSWQFLTSYTSRRAEDAGIYAALVGSMFVIALTAAIAIPLGVAAALHLEEYGGHGRLSRLIEINISNLAGVPAIIYGLLGLGLFVRSHGHGTERAGRRVNAGVARASRRDPVDARSASRRAELAS